MENGPNRKKGGSYRDAGVDIAAGDALVKRIAPLARATRRAGADAELGGFGALFDLKAAGFADPLLVSSTDGVGTKLKIAIETGNFSTIGQDLVAMCVNDIVVQGAEPLFFLDYYATGRLNVDNAARVIEGIAKACRECACALIGGETAEMPGLYAEDDFDLAGFAVGAVERARVLPRLPDIRPGDVLVGVASSGLHSNGFSLVRRIVANAGARYDAPAPFATNKSLGDVLLTPTTLYVKSAVSAINAGVKAFAHVTGGGITENLPRVLPRGVAAEIDLSAWSPAPVFGWLARTGGVDQPEMLKTFNCGIGLIAVVAAENAAAVIDRFSRHSERAVPIGRVVPAEGEPHVVYRGALL